MAGEWGLHPVMADRVRRYCGACGLTVTSGGRSRERQGQLYDCWNRRQRGCAPANRPGTSNHEDLSGFGGLAADLGPRGRVRDPAVRRRAGEFGLHFPIPGEPWHVQPVECRSGRWTGNCLGGVGGGGGGRPTLRRGARGDAVRHLQDHLRAAGHDPGRTDGSFGPRTDAAVRAFQASRGLVVDGVVGPRTWGALG